MYILGLNAYHADYSACILKDGQLLAGYHYFILPTKGENFGHAIFEAFKIVKPVITTGKPPWNGLEVKQAGWNYPLNDREALKKIITNAIEMNNDEYQPLCRGAQKVAEEYLQKHNFIEQYHQLFEIK